MKISIGFDIYHYIIQGWLCLLLLWFWFGLRFGFWFWLFVLRIREGNHFGCRLEVDHWSGFPVNDSFFFEILQFNIDLETHMLGRELHEPIFKLSFFVNQPSNDYCFVIVCDFYPVVFLLLEILHLRQVLVPHNIQLFFLCHVIPHKLSDGLKSDFIIKIEMLFDLINDISKFDLVEI